jgi:tRNA threonylcarbamoyladenosine biosynthesis protein TsaB
LSEPKILAVDTCFGACSAAVTVGECVLAGRYEVMQRGHAEALAPMVDAVMKGSGLAFADLDKLAVTTGPGTFTGQRVGLAFMRALRVALGKPLIGITSLAAMAEQARQQTDCAVAAAVHDAKRGEVYIEMVGHPLAARLMTLTDAKALLRPFDHLALAGTAAALLVPTCNDAVVTDIVAADAVWVARLAVTAKTEASPRPLYLRAPDAKLPTKR